MQYMELTLIKITLESFFSSSKQSPGNFAFHMKNKYKITNKSLMYVYTKGD